MKSCLQRYVIEINNVMQSGPKNSPLVTIGITTYDRPDTLKQTIQSVLDQTYKNLEILIIDDCSPAPFTDKVVSEFVKKDKRIQYIKQSENKGVETNFNHLVKKSKGEYFMWLCDDDWIDSTYIQECLKYKLNNPTYAVVSGKTKFYWKNKFAFYGEVINVTEDSGFERVLSFYDHQLGTANCPNFGILETSKIRLIPLKRILGHDNVFLSNVAFLGKIKTIDNVCIHRRLGGSSESLSKSALTFRHSSFEVNIPFLALWKNIFVDIAWESHVYEPLGFAKRFFLAVYLSVAILLNFFKYFSRYKKVRPERVS